ncbi:hypothetical protein [Roseateles amylovorans]|uniref:Uncharacterized protein n=1 Tax=Roseateles amylovorans TaxID=2978473 RepID=A0ABY6B1H5_9BURK|nr:hypothetical protein [Roseateles amylovorans]UXH78403.1 hypothetical protein N4261_00200 [Roseateles amylovorans]
MPVVGGAVVTAAAEALGVEVGVRVGVVGMALWTDDQNSPAR